ncbi:MAG: ribonuclease HII [Verrucomicrobiales bacterium]|nr:ribonuclease HII [Verrucomicrobiales bacterium]|tara:strand:+ start:1640 stop:2290 length:651 start_codon:yes stop_codon:yes gene_type:complete
MAEPDRFSYEKDLLDKRVYPLAGIDEAGRGPLAGPVVAAAVIFPRNYIRDGLPESLTGLNDSKKLPERKRDSLFEALTSDDKVRGGVASIDAATIDSINILRATFRAMNEALAKLPELPVHSLVDGKPVKTLTTAQTAIVKGDSLSFSIAAASILAKVTRDRMMVEYDREYPSYGFAKHKGYGTKDHLAAIAEHGPCAIHRMSFAPLKPPAQKEFF